MYSFKTQARCKCTYMVLQVFKTKSANENHNSRKCPQSPSTAICQIVFKNSYYWCTNGSQWKSTTSVLCWNKKKYIIVADFKKLTAGLDEWALERPVLININQSLLTSPPQWLTNIINCVTFQHMHIWAYEKLIRSIFTWLLTWQDKPVATRIIRHQFDKY